MEFDEEIREFLIESNENLACLDREILELEQNPADSKLVSSAFRTIHTIKGTCGFFGFAVLGSVAHGTENLLSQVREGQRVLTPRLISLVLEAVDAIKAILATIETAGAEGEDDTGPLRDRLEAALLSEEPAEEKDDAKSAQAEFQAAPAPGKAASPVYEPAVIAGAQAEQAAWAAGGGATLDMLAGVPTAPAPVAVTSAEAKGAAARAKAFEQVHRTVAARREADQQPAAAMSSPVDGESQRESQLADTTIRVDVGLLNRLMNLVGELVLARNQLLQNSASHSPALQKTSQRLNLITSELQEGLMKTRMQPIGVVWNKLPRVVRDLAAQCGKRIRIEMEGAGTELDRTVLESIKDPLTHIIRNACDHGIETPELRAARGKPAEGLVELRAYHEGGVVNIEISDDGSGIDPERVKNKALERGLLRADQAAQLSTREALHLIFLPGFSTAAAITSISGRGVGMDVVKTNIERIGGSVEVGNRGAIGTGTILRIKIPLTLAIIPGLLVTLRGRKGAGEQQFILPQANLLELVRLEGAEQLRRIEDVHGTPVFHHRGKLLPLLHLARVLGEAPGEQGAGEAEDEAVHILVVQAENRPIGLVVDTICDSQEIVVKPVGRQLKSLACYAGATILGDGRPALILDVAGLARLAGLPREVAPLPVADGAGGASGEGTAQAQRLLLFRSGLCERVAVPLARVDRLEEIRRAEIEQAAGRPVLCYRGEILPLVRLGGDLRTEPGNPASTHAQVVVFAHETGRVGLLVDQILDIVEEPVTGQRRESTLPGLAGAAIIGGRITDLLDLDALLAGARDTAQARAESSLHHPFLAAAQAMGATR